MLILSLWLCRCFTIGVRRNGQYYAFVSSINCECFDGTILYNDYKQWSICFMVGSMNYLTRHFVAVLNLFFETIEMCERYHFRFIPERMLFMLWNSVGSFHVSFKKGKEIHVQSLKSDRWLLEISVEKKLKKSMELKFLIEDWNGIVQLPG